MRYFNLAYDCTHYDKNGKVIKITTAIEAEARRWQAEFGTEFKVHESVVSLAGIRKETQEATCVVCNIRFYSPHTNAVYCGVRCRNRRKKKPLKLPLPERNCKWCSIPFQPSRANNNFCNTNGRKCVDAYLRMKQREARIKLKKERALNDE